MSSDRVRSQIVDIATVFVFLPHSLNDSNKYVYRCNSAHTKIIRTYCDHIYEEFRCEKQYKLWNTSIEHSVATKFRFVGVFSERNERIQGDRPQYRISESKPKLSISYPKKLMRKVTIVTRESEAKKMCNLCNSNLNANFSFSCETVWLHLWKNWTIDRYWRGQSRAHTHTYTQVRTLWKLKIS